MAKKDNFMEGLYNHWENSPRCNCINCKKYSDQKAKFLEESK